LQKVPEDHWCKRIHLTLVAPILKKVHFLLPALRVNVRENLMLNVYINKLPNIQGDVRVARNSA